MTIRYSTALRNFLQIVGSFKDAFDGGVLLLYSGTQPATADAAATGTLLATISVNSGAVTSEILATGSVTLTGGGAGSVNTLTVNSIDILGGAVNFNTSLTQTATDVAAQINKNPKNKLFTASAVGAIITLTAVPGQGALPNGWVVSQTLTTITATDVNIGSGVAGVAAVNGLQFGPVVSGTLSKDPSQIWSGVGTAGAGVGTTAGWFRLCGSVVDAQALDSAAVFIRLDGSVATSGADMNVSSANVVQAATFTINTFSPTEPGTA